MTLNLGYALSIAIFFATVAAQVASKSFHRFLYWSVVVATTTICATPVAKGQGNGSRH
jgi:uncharacterized membrane-anchored protein